MNTKLPGHFLDFYGVCIRAFFSLEDIKLRGYILPTATIDKSGKMSGIGCNDDNLIVRNRDIQLLDALNGIYIKFFGSPV